MFVSPSARSKIKRLPLPRSSGSLLFICVSSLVFGQLLIEGMSIRTDSQDVNTVRYLSYGLCLSTGTPCGYIHSTSTHIGKTDFTGGSDACNMQNRVLRDVSPMLRRGYI